MRNICSHVHFHHYVRIVALIQVESNFISVGDVHVEPSSEARNLGAIMDQHSTLRPHVKNTCRSAMAAIHKIGQIRNCLNNESTNTIIHSFVTSRLDFNNGLLANIANKDIAQLQRIQNIAARITTKTKRHEHITPILESLHWLPVDKRIQFKILLLTFKALNGTAPKYITELLRYYTPVRTLRSQSQLLLQVPKTPSTTGTEPSTSLHQYSGTISLCTFAL